MYRGDGYLQGDEKMKIIEDIKLSDTLPDSIARDDKVSAAAGAIDPRLRDIGKQVDLALIYARIDKLSSLALDHLAEQFSVIPWRDDWSVSLKISVIKECIANKRKRGTLKAIMKAVESLGSAVYITPWYEQDPPGTPGTFNIVATYFDGAKSGEEAQEDVIRAIEYAKPFSRHFSLTMMKPLKGGISVYGCIRPVTVTKIHNL